MNRISLRTTQFLHKLYFVAAILLIIFAVLVTTLRLLTPIAKRYQPDIQTWATMTLGKPVTIGDMSTGWHNFHPMIELNNITIIDKSSKTPFHINSVRISIAVFDSLWHKELRINQLIFDGMHLDVQEDAQHQWHVEGFPTNVDTSPTQLNPLNGSSANPALVWLFSQPELAVQNISATVKVDQYPGHIIHNLKLMLTNKGNNHYLRGEIIFNDVQRSTVFVAANMTGSANDLPNLTAKVFVSGKKLHLVNWLSSDPYDGFQVTQGALSFKLWGDWQQQRLQSLQSNFNLQNVQLKAADDSTLINIQQFSGNALLKMDAPNWQLTADNLQLTINQHLWPVNKLGIFVTQTPQGVQQTAQVGFLQLQDLVPLLTHTTAIPADIRTQIRNYHPQGELNSIYLVHLIDLINQGSLKQSTSYQMMAHLKNVGVNRSEQFPGVQHLTADINVTSNNGSVKIDSADTTFDFGNLFHQPLTLQKFEGIIQWQHTAQALLVQGLQLNLQHPNMSLQSNFSLLLPKQGEPSLRLLAQFKETDISKIKQFLPISLLAPSAVQWLEQAFVSGDGLQGGMVLTGPLNKFPYFQSEGQFIVQARVNNIQLHFAPDWPTINHLDGDLTFHKRGMFFKLQAADLYQLPIKKLTASIPDMGADPQAHLYVDGNIDLPSTAQAEDFVFHSPLRDSVGKSLAGINLQGKGDLHLNLIVPLTSGDTKTKGQLNLRANTLAIPSLNLNFTQLTGLINFTDSGISSPLLMANFFGQPLTLSIKTTHEHGERFTAFDMNSVLNMGTVEQYFSLPKLDFLNGSTAFKARLRLNSNNDAMLRIRTDLQGVAIALPAPFGKTAEKIAPFVADVDIKSNQAPHVKLSYKNLWKLFLRYQKEGQKNGQKESNGNILEKVLIHFGSGNSVIPAPPGIYITGMLNHFYWEQWQPILKTYFLTKPEQTEKTSLPLQDINLFVNHLTGFKQIIDQAQIHLSRQIQPGNNAWIAGLVSPQIDGQLIIPDDQTQAIKGQFKTIYLTALTKGGGADINKFDPSQMLFVDIHADDFHYGAKNFGAVTLQAQPISQGMQIQKLSINNADLSLDTKGSWTRKNNHDNSNFTGTLKTDNLGKLLKQQDITDHIKDGKGQIDFSLAWPASPVDFSANTLAGDITLDFKGGAIIGLSQATNEKIGLGKVLNALSIQNIYDRLTFQNKSIDSEGFTFSEMKATLTFKSGDIFTNDAYINGQVAQIFINGRLGLSNENFDLLIKVSPYLTSSLPIIATIAGGPIIGAITWAADKVVSVGIEKTVIYSYRITGPWTDPVVESAGK